MNIYLGENIKRLRREKDITQETLAEFLGVTFQSISKWERGESYPDITLLPAIAGFFNVSIDELMGVNKAQDEEELETLLKEYDGLRWDVERKWKALDELREKYPTDFRVQIRYIGKILNSSNEEFAEQSSKIKSIYENIQRNCTNDAIRIEAKTYYISYLLRMISLKDDNVTFDNVDKVIKQLPSLRDGRELNCFVYEYFNKSPEAIHETLELLIHMLFDVLSGWYYHSAYFSLDYQIEIQENILKAINYIYTDGNYGLMWKAVICSCYGVTSMFYYRKGDYNNALSNLRKSAELAIKFDSLDRYTTMHSPLFEGHIFDKYAVDRDFCAKKEMKKAFLTDYNFSDDFKSTAEFKEIIAMLS